MKKSINIAFCIAFCLFLSVITGCNTPDNTEQESGLPRIKASLNESVNISDFAESIRVIRLSNDSIVRDIEKLLIDDAGNFYIIDSKGTTLQKFDKNGKFISQISRRGKGPGEYLEIYDFDIDNNQIIIYDSNRDDLMYFDMEGNFLSMKPTGLDYYLSFVSVNDTVYACHGGSYTDVFLNGEKIYETPRTPPEKRISGYIHSTHQLTKNGNEVYWERVYNDTIYRVTAKGAQPAFIIDFGPLKIPADIPMNNDILGNPDMYKYSRDPSNFQVSDKFISFHFVNALTIYNCIYNRETGKSYIFKFLNNDMNPIPFDGEVFAIRGNKLYMKMGVDDLCSYFDFLKSENKKEHKEIIDKITSIIGPEPLTEMDNPLIFEVTCK
ncbi:MAG: 6-bladed beta-propeller [Bacteroidaceae bacterium]|nr:6-bladed beta-propeller [Bacteroidaceae bacterium]